LVFVKAGSSIKDSIPTRTVTSYFASTTFGAGTKYQHDTNAFCVFRADTNFVNITGLVNTNTYHVSIWVVEDGDSVYSLTPTIVSGVTQLPPAHSNISDINKINSTTGVPDSLAKYVKLSGIVYGFNQRNNGLTFVLRDATGGITVSSTNKNFGYTVTEGDSVMVQGIVTTNRGLLQVSTIDTLISYTSGHALKQPSVVTALNENTENDLVKVEGLRFVTTPTGGNWPFATTIIRAVKNGTTDTFNIRLVSTSGLAGTPLPTTTLFNVVGLGGQISSSTLAPFAFDGYNLMPRTAADIELIDSLSAIDLVSPADGADVFVTDTISGSVQFTWTSSKPYPGVSNPSYQFMYDTVGGTFASPVISKTVTDTFVTLTHKELAQILIQSGVSTGQSYYGTWKVIATADGFSKSSSTVFAAQLKNSINSGLFEANATIEVNCYPNPVKDVLTVSLKDNKGNLELYDITGRLIQQQRFNATSFTVSFDNLKQGVYYLKIETANGTATQKLVKE
jgi:DNA/RNA endonuclease YhcR with UshA esterase domain